MSAPAPCRSRRGRWCCWPSPALLPLLSAVAAWAAPASEVWPHQLAARAAARRLEHGAAAAGRCAVATACSVLRSPGWSPRTIFPDAVFFAWALLLPLALPGYVLAVVFAGALDFAGPLQSAAARSAWRRRRLPPVRSLGGAALVLTLGLYPYVYLLARVAFEYGRRAHARGRAVARARPWCGLPHACCCRWLGRRSPPASGSSAWRRWPTSAWSLRSTSTPSPRAIYRAWFGMFSLAAALQMAALLALLALAGVWLERRLRGGRGFAAQRPSGALQRAATDRRARAGCHCGRADVLAVAFVLPMAQLLAWAWRHAAVDLDVRYWAFAARSVALAASGDRLVMAAASRCTVMRCGAERRAWAAGLGRFATVGYAIPGTVLAVGLFAPVAALNGWMQGLRRSGDRAAAVPAGHAAHDVRRLPRALPGGRHRAGRKRTRAHPPQPR